MNKSVKRMYKVKELLPSVYGISSGLVMSYLIVGKTGAMLIDTAYGFEDISQVVKEITSLPITVVNSHGHIDHSGGNFYFDVPTHIHEADVDVYKIHNMPEGHREMEKTIRVFHRIFFWRNLLSKDPTANDKKRMNFQNFCFVKDGDTFELGELSAEIIEIPGHTTGSIAVFFPEVKLVIASDGANAGTFLFLPESTNLSTYVASLHKLEKLDFTNILTGHTQKLCDRTDLISWLNVAEHPDMNTAKVEKEIYFAPGVKQMRVWAIGDEKHKGPSLVIDPKKMD